MYLNMYVCKYVFKIELLAVVSFLFQYPVYQFSSVQLLSCVDSLQPCGLQHAKLPCLSPTPGACSDSCSLSQWCNPTILPSIIPFSSCLQSFPALGSFPMSQFFASGGHSIGVSASASVLPMNIQDWFPLGLTPLISLQSKGPSRVFWNTTVKSINSLVLSFLYGPSPRTCSDSCSLSQWCHLTISSSVFFSSCLQSFPALRSFLISQFFTSHGHSIGVSASASVLPMNIQDWFL